jgi:CubicO group peptidase (beta-lactamase class C family)
MDSPTPAEATTDRDCSRRLRALQRSARAPSIAAAIVRDGTLTWSDSTGLADVEGWTLAWRLGLMLYRKAERIFHGHAGGMPGFVSSLMAYAKDGTRAGVIVLATRPPASTPRVSPPTC